MNPMRHEIILNDQLQALRPELLRAFDALEVALEHLESVFKERIPCTVLIWGDPALPPLTQALQAYQRLDYLDDPEADTCDVRVCPGVVAADHAMIAAAGAVNQAKDQLSALLTAVRTKKVGVRDTETGAIAYQPMARVCLELVGRPRISRPMLARHVHCLSSCPARVGFTWTHTRNVHRKTVEQLHSRLDAFAGQPGYEEDRARLAQYPNDQVLAYVEGRFTSVRANVWEQANSRRPVQYMAMLPLLVPMEDVRQRPPLVLPRHPFTTEAAGRHRPRRLEAEPYLQLLPVYRYRDGFTH